MIPSKTVVDNNEKNILFTSCRKIITTKRAMEDNKRGLLGVEVRVFHFFSLLFMFMCISWSTSRLFFVPLLFLHSSSRLSLIYLLTKSWTLKTECERFLFTSIAKFVVRLNRLKLLRRKHQLKSYFFSNIPSIFSSRCLTRTRATPWIYRAHSQKESLSPTNRKRSCMKRKISI